MAVEAADAERGIRPAPDSTTPIATDRSDVAESTFRTHGAAEHRSPSDIELVEVARPLLRRGIGLFPVAISWNVAKGKTDKRHPYPDGHPRHGGRDPQNPS